MATACGLSSSSSLRSVAFSGLRRFSRAANAPRVARFPSSASRGVVCAARRRRSPSNSRAAAEGSSALEIADQVEQQAEQAEQQEQQNQLEEAPQEQGEQGQADVIVEAVANGGANVFASEDMDIHLHLLQSDMEVDAVVAADMKENGSRSTRRTKLICTVGPASCSFKQLEALASGGMNVARLNMCHGTHEWHRDVVEKVRRLNAEKGYSIAIMMDTEGSEIHLGDLPGDSSVKAEDGDLWTFTVRQFPGPLPPQTVQLNYDGFVDDITVGDEVVADGGMVRFQVLRKIGPDVTVRVIDPGLILPRANVTFFRDGKLVRGRNSMLPTISSKDWIDVDFGISMGVDFIAISFVKSPDVITHLRSYINARSPDRYIGLISKIESCESIVRLEEIIAVSDGAMVARGDLGAQIPLEEVPSVQQDIVQICRDLNKPVIVASQLLESMIEFPTPTRAEVADTAEAVRQRADALMLSGESAIGQFPEKALAVLRTVATRIEGFSRAERSREQEADIALLPELSDVLSERISEQICASAAHMAAKLQVDAIFVFTHRGYMASLLSRCRPDCPIFAFTSSQGVRQQLNLSWGLIPFRLDFSDDMESNILRTFNLLKVGVVSQSGDLVITVTDIIGSDSSFDGGLQSMQIRNVP
ncbi:hypothetical protein CLOP_g21624 [Closterium sp. NIES-67]|nr:hypothetical protein CLOP_g21624 [Closterium sp. NIES-67]